MDKNKKGMALFTALFVFLVLSILTFMFVGRSVQSGFSGRRYADSTEAFWLADAGVEKAKFLLQQSTPTIIDRNDTTNWPAPLGDGEYDVYSEIDRSCVDTANAACVNIQPRVEGCFEKTSAGNTAYQAYMATACYVDCPQRWVVCSRGESQPDNPQGNQLREIQAVISSYNIKNALTTHGTVNDAQTPTTCQGQGGAMIVGGCVPQAVFTFESVFNGTTMSDVIGLTTPVMDPPNNVVINSGVTVYYLTGNNNGLSLNTSNVVYPNASFLIVDTTGVNANKQPVSLSFAGGAHFCGIVWIVGEGKFVGTANIKGAVFVDGQPAEDTKVSGTNDIIFDPPCIENALNSLGSTYNDTPSLISWKEKDF